MTAKKAQNDDIGGVLFYFTEPDENGLTHLVIELYTCDDEDLNEIVHAFGKDLSATLGIDIQDTRTDITTTLN